jgi:iron complex transport system substrate-binding protein
MTIEHKFGSTKLDKEPKRVVSIGFSDQDYLLALGVKPVGIREWYGEYPSATWPWAQDELGDAKPTVLASAELNFEQIASLEPDLIVGVSSGMTDTDYQKLARIAPTLAQPKEFIDYGTPWDVTTELIGRAVGRATQAADVVKHVEDLYAKARTDHPEFKGKTAAVAFLFDGSPGAYASQDSRSRVITDLSFTIPAKFDELSKGSFYFSVSNEDISTLDTDVIIWIGGSDADIVAVKGIALRPGLRAYKEGREIAADTLLSGAFSFASPLSIEYVLDKLVPELAVAVDGKPDTAVPSAAAIGAAAPAGAATLTGDENVAADTFATVFDSTVGFDAKAALLAEPDVVKAAAEAYTKAGSAMGGITLKPTAAAITGDSATITYDVLFGSAVAYQSLTKTINRVNGNWVVPTTVFCEFLTAARVPCP